jgi:hypothetical protein
MQERTMRRVERAAARRSSAIVTLTSAAVPELARRHGEPVGEKSRVVTTCVDLNRFSLSPMPSGSVRFLLSGSFNPLYDVETMLGLTTAFKQRASCELTMLRPGAGPSDDVVRAHGGTVASSSYNEMPTAIARHHVGLSVCTVDHPAALIAAMPTKIGEFLACGRPVVVSPGLGDADRLLPVAGAGVVVTRDPASWSDACDRLLDLVADPDTPARCRALAESHFSLDRGVEQLLELYRAL